MAGVRGPGSGETTRVDAHDADTASVLRLRQQVLDEWPEGEKKDAVLAALDRLLRETEERQQEGGIVRPEA